MSNYNAGKAEAVKALAESRSREGKGVLETMLDSVGQAFHCLCSSTKDIDWNEFGIDQEEVQDEEA